MKDILDNIKGKKVLVVGDVGLDKYTYGKVERISPEAPVPIFLFEKVEYKLGLAANVAANIKSLGGKPLLMSVIGGEKEKFLDLLYEQKIDNWIMEDWTRITTIKERVVAGQQLLRIDKENIHFIPESYEEDFEEEIKAVLPSMDIVIIEDYAKGMLSYNLTQTIIEVAQKHNKMIIVDPNMKTPLENYHGATVLTPNLKEAEHLSGDNFSMNDSAHNIMKLSTLKYLLITKSKDGMSLFTNNNREDFPSYATSVVDVSGAGDTVVAMLALALSVDNDIIKASKLANVAAAVSVSKMGTSTVSVNEVKNMLDKLDL